jgi:4-aminobutyrate aminotransferase/(S)-3-amino-2-methylpropionate transaminase
MPSIRLQTEIPGPLSRDLLVRRQNAVARGIGNTVPVFVDRASGATVTDIDGNTFLDFGGGIGTMNVGHRHPEVSAAAIDQVNRFGHVCFAVTMYESYVALAEKLNAIAPGAGPKKTMLANSGAEAVENAVKIARRATGRPGVLVFDYGFHGRTLLALTMTSKVAPYKQGFGPFATDVHRLPFPYEYRSTGPLDAAACRRTFDEFFSGFVGADQIACVMIEPVAGEGGFLVVPPDWMRELQAICRDNGILLIADEVQTGFGRTGKMFASEHYGIEPDLVTLAKSMGAGFPISAVTGRAEVMDAAQPGGLGGTFVGHPVSCAAALAAIEVIERERLPERAAAIGEVVRRRFEAFRERYDFVGDARGLGAMRALELVTDKKSKGWDKDRLQRTIKNAWQRGLILVAAGNHGNVLRTLMPLVISDAELEEGLDVLEAALEASSS